jgi:hypothetical protein
MLVTICDNYSFNKVLHSLDLLYILCPFGSSVDHDVENKHYHIYIYIYDYFTRPFETETN